MAKAFEYLADWCVLRDEARRDNVKRRLKKQLASYLPLPEPKEPIYLTE